MMKKLGAVLLVIAACKGGDGTSRSGSSGEKSGKGGCETTAAKPAELVVGKTPQLLAPLSSLKLGMSPAEAAKVCPNFFEEEDGKKTGTFRVGEIVGKFGETYAQAGLDFDSDKLVKVDLSLPSGIADALTAAWGAPIVSSGAKPAHAWVDEASGLRAVLGPAEADGRRELEVSAFMPLIAFVEPETTKLAWKPQDILGKKPADIAKSLAQFVKVEKTSAAVKAKTDEMMADMKKDMEKMGVDTTRGDNDPKFELPATPLSTGPTMVILHTNEDGTVRSYGVWFRTENSYPGYGFPTQSADLMKLYDAKWGAPKKIKDTLGERTTWFDAARGLRVSAEIKKPEDFDVSYARYMPLARFFGAPGPVWGFEKAERPLIGATPAEIVATYGKEFGVKVDPKGETITMSLPPTDYDGDTSQTTILMFVRSGKVGDWRTHVPFNDYEPAKAEYEALLEAKLGKPKAAKDHFLYGAKPTVDAEYSKYTHALNLEVTK